MFILIIRGRNVAYGPFDTEQEADDWLVEKSPDDINEDPHIMKVESPEEAGINSSTEEFDYDRS